MRARIIALVLALVAGTAPAEPAEGPVTGLPMPRFVSLKAGEANARRGPSTAHAVDWVFRRAGMPLEVVAEYEHWRRVRDIDGVGGWVHYALLSGVRTAIVLDDLAAMRTHPGGGREVARLEAGVVVRVPECAPVHCRVRVAGQTGWLPAGALWGVRPGETFD
ncbi:SH3-like domain-containing protein [Hasllibacter halocynthiae]|uniref:SH3-like domain-containing protein n=1 Tax=Hasllibacter halocynthiae TaxID=595589 RepID=A0A2T0X122_9RHOB|nr:SH3 domain-containing protein [Hasllibacter halocynthiae]PRY92653.1 SH3-like domain-containing protein [Hasllibacter halocynthiae]